MAYFIGRKGVWATTIKEKTEGVSPSLESWLGCWDSGNGQCHLERKGSFQSHTVPKQTHNEQKLNGLFVWGLWRAASAVPWKREAPVCVSVGSVPAGEPQDGRSGWEPFLPPVYPPTSRLPLLTCSTGKAGPTQRCIQMLSERCWPLLLLLIGAHNQRIRYLMNVLGDHGPPVYQLSLVSESWFRSKPVGASVSPRLTWAVTWWWTLGSSQQSLLSKQWGVQSVLRALMLF